MRASRFCSSWSPAVAAAVGLALTAAAPARGEAVDVFFAGGQSNAHLSPWATTIEATLADSGGYDNIQMVHARHSGESIANWVLEDGGGHAKQANYLNDFFNDAGTGLIQQKLADIAAAGDTPVFRGFFWFQGESDTDNTHEIDAYRDRLLAMLDLLRADMGIDEPIPFAMAVIDFGVNHNLTASHQARVNDLRAVQMQIGADLDHAVAVDTRDFSRRDTWHLDNDQYAPYAQMMADAFLVNNAPEPASAGLLVGGLVAALYRGRFR